MKTVEIRDEAGLRTLRPSWNALLGESASATTFLTWEWLNSWWSAYGEPGQLRILLAYDGNEVLRGIAPLRLDKIRRYGQEISSLSFIGDGSNDSDYLDFAIASGCEGPVLESFYTHWSAALKSGTILALNEIPGESPNLAILRELARSRGELWVESPVACGTVHLPGGWDDYLKMLRPRFRTKVRSVLRALESHPAVSFRFASSSGEMDRLLPALFDLHRRRWAQDGKPGVFGWDRKRDFYSILSPFLMERGWLRLGYLEWQGRILACQYGFVYRGTYFQLQEGYEPDSEHWSVGLGLRAWSIRELLKEGVRTYDFLGGIGRHKSDWGAEVKHSKRIIVAKDTLGNHLLCRGPEWEGQLRESVRSFLPERVLAMRNAAFEPKQKEAPVSGEEFMLKAAAGCYSRLRLAALTRPFRERYQLSLSTNGSRPKMSVERRGAPSGRILYYHRINDEDDPFFPAISTALFEQQMRFLAKHYRVVRLASLIERLQMDSPVPLVAITFDDGYQDNYRNAFPILRRYGLPATIFLTTGSIDSGEPLWFEQLAEAVKKTGRESMDLEIDIPRRFWLRTPEERLSANSAIFRLLRGLKDPERRQWLQRILAGLAAPASTARRAEMLDWNQVREMNAAGIDFGGHTVTHPFLSRMSREDAAWEVSECRRRIEEELQSPAHLFAYPNGRDEDFAPWNKELLRQAGYQAAATTIWGINNRSTDTMELRRGGPWENSAALFALKLDWYQFVNG